MNASLAYEILMYLNSFYFGMFMLCEFAMGILKAINLSYPENKLLIESCILLTLCLVEIIRIVLGKKGSLSDRGWQVIVSVILTFPSAAGVIYFFLLQTYILKLEYILCALMLGIQISQLFSAFIFIFTLCRRTNEFEYT